MEARGRPRQQAGEGSQLQSKLIQLKPQAVRAFDVLKAEQGPRSGPRLIAEAIDLLLVKYGKKKIGYP